MLAYFVLTLLSLEGAKWWGKLVAFDCLDLSQIGTMVTELYELTSMNRRGQENQREPRVTQGPFGAPGSSWLILAPSGSSCILAPPGSFQASS